MDGLSRSQFQGVHMNDIPIVEDLLTLNILLCDIDVVAVNFVGELARRRVRKYESTVRLLQYDNHICYMNNLVQSSNHFAASIKTIFSTEHSIRGKI